MHTPASAGPSFQQDHHGILIWNPQPAEGETVLWEGPQANGYAEGTGTLTWYWHDTAISVYNGAMVRGKPEGQGRYAFADGDIYEGAWKEGLREGFGKQWYKDGRYYEGLWQQDKPLGIH